MIPLHGGSNSREFREVDPEFFGRDVLCAPLVLLHTGIKALETRLFAEGYGRLATVVDVPGHCRHRREGAFCW